jgi:hypothetical protein
MYSRLMFCNPPTKIQSKTNRNSGGQECPPHTPTYWTVRATLAVCDSEPLVAVTVML